MSVRILSTIFVILLGPSALALTLDDVQGTWILRGVRCQGKTANTYPIDEAIKQSTGSLKITKDEFVMTSDLRTYDQRQAKTFPECKAVTSSGSLKTGDQVIGRGTQTSVTPVFVDVCAHPDEDGVLRTSSNVWAEGAHMNITMRMEDVDNESSLVVNDLNDDCDPPGAFEWIYSRAPVKK